MQVPHIIVQERNDYDILSPTSIREGTRISTPEPTLFFWPPLPPSLTPPSAQKRQESATASEKINHNAHTRTSLSLSLSSEHRRGRKAVRETPSRWFVIRFWGVALLHGVCLRERMAAWLPSTPLEGSKTKKKREKASVRSASPSCHYLLL